MRPKGNIIGDMVFGANDGIVTTFAVVAGVTGASLSSSIVLIMGLANLLADGISMAAGDYLGKESEKEVDEYQNHVRRAIHPLQNALAIFVAFVVAGALPLVPYLVGVDEHAFGFSVLCAGAAMFATGALRSLATGRKWFPSGLEVLGIGAVAAGAAYVVGFVLKNIG